VEEAGLDLEIRISTPEYDSIHATHVTGTTGGAENLYIYNFDDQPWRWDAACIGQPDHFFPERGASTAHAKALCDRCPVKFECLEFAVTNNERFGIWGGLAERERRRIRARMARGVPFIEAAMDADRKRRMQKRKV
jgi:WhiB family redox-sensing transcriptional regulator